MRARLPMLVSTALIGLLGACGKSSKPGHWSPEPDAQAGEGGASSGGSSVQGGSSPVAGGGNGGDGGDPSEAGAPSAGASTGGASATGGTGATAGTESEGGTNTGGSTAGTSAAGAATIALPERCGSNGQHIGGEYCSVDMTCDSGRAAVSCTQHPDNGWRCTCLKGNVAEEYFFPTAAGVATCEAAAKACADPSLLDGEEICSRKDQQSSDFCAIRDDCALRHEIDGVTLIIERDFEASCELCRDNLNCCSCTDDRRDIDYLLSGIDFTAGCRFLNELCETDALQPAGETTCAPLYEELYPDYGCSARLGCNQPHLLGDDTPLTVSRELGISCYVTDGGGLCQCTAGTGGHLLSLGFEAPPVDLTTCRATAKLCANPESLELQDPLECAATSSYIAAFECAVTQDCVQPGTAGDTEVTVHTRVSVNCHHRQGDIWDCACDDGEPNPRFDVEAHDPESACALTAQTCPRSPKPL